MYKYLNPIFITYFISEILEWLENLYENTKMCFLNEAKYKNLNLRNDKDVN